MKGSIHLTYLKGIIPDSELEEFHESFSRSGIDFNCTDISEEPQASVEELLAPIVLFLSSDIVQAYILGLATSTSYDLIKNCVLSIWRHISGQKIATITASGIETTKEANLDLDIDLDNRTRIKFKLKGDIPDTLKEQCIDRAFRLLEKTDFLKNYTVYIGLYEVDNSKWEIYENVEFVRKFVKPKAG